MTVSFPSELITFIDIPEPKNISAKFVYNFFMADESINPNADTRNSRLTSKSSKKGKSDKLTLNERQRLPRYIQLSFSPVIVSTNVKSRNEFRADSKQGKKLPEMMIADHLNSVQTELGFSNGKFSGISLQDTDVDQKISDLFEESIQANSNTTATEKSKLGNRATTRLVDGELLTSLLNNAEKGIEAIDEETREIINNDSFQSVRSMMIGAQINNKFIHRIIQSAADDASSIFSDEFELLVNDAAKIQQEVLARSSATHLNEDEFEITINPIRQRLFDADEFDSSTKIIGYLIDKTEVLEDGSVVTLPPIVIENQMASNYVDTNVKYGATYIYQIRAVAQCEIQAISEETDEIIASTLLVSSRPGARAVVKCIETRPPPPPVDIDIRWDYKKQMPMVMWNFPPNRQRDIKKFQVFKREHIGKSFELLKMYDFDDSLVRLPYTEPVPRGLVQRSRQPILLCYDSSFTKFDTAIYSVCALDARNYSSNYSMQIQVTFDHFKNEIIKEVISTSGAPKAYPNIYLESDLFVDTVRDSNHDRVRIIFDPEYLSLINSAGEDLGLIATTDDKNKGKYQLQILNVDHQKSQKIDIFIEDLRSEAKTGSEKQKRSSQPNKRR